MKTLILSRKILLDANRWDIDFHLPAKEIKKFPNSLIKKIDDIAYIRKEKRDPRLEGDLSFKYIDISCVDVQTGLINNYQDLIGEEAPSRARKVVSAYDILISTCRPTRGAIAVVPLEYHNEIASTGFSVLVAKENINPFYLFFVLRLESTLEQFRKFSTGSSYPAILDEDVLKTLIPVPPIAEQNRIAKEVFFQIQNREQKIKQANNILNEQLNALEAYLAGSNRPNFNTSDIQFRLESFDLSNIMNAKAKLSALRTTQDIKNNLVLINTKQNESELS